MDAMAPEHAKKAQQRQIALGVIAVLVLALCLANLDEVEVNWIVASWSTPLIVVILVSALLGGVADRLLQRRSRPGKTKGRGKEG